MIFFSFQRVGRMCFIPELLENYLRKEPGFPRDKTTDNWESWETNKINYESFVAVLVKCFRYIYHLDNRLNFASLERSPVYIFM